MPLEGIQNVHPVPTVLDRGRIVLSRRSWNGVHPRIQARGFCGTGQTGLCCGLMCISEDLLD